MWQAHAQASRDARPGATADQARRHPTGTWPDRRGAAVAIGCASQPAANLRGGDDGTVECRFAASWLRAFV